MAFLAHQGLVDAVMTEDSDLVAHGCPVVLLKTERDGSCVELRFADLPANSEVSFVGFTASMVLEMCVLSGCDYLPSLPGLGIKRAHALIRRYRTAARALRHLRFEGVHVPAGYEAGFTRALWTFRHQRVWDPTTRAMTHLHDLSTSDLAEVRSGSARTSGLGGACLFLGCIPRSSD